TLQTLQSRQFLTDFISRHELKVPLLATRGWDDQRQQWVIDSEQFDVQQSLWLPRGSANANPEPSDWRAYKALRGMLSVSEDRDSGMVTLNLESLSPVAAQQWLDWLVADINEHLKRREMNDTRRNVAYLEQQLERTNVSGMRQVFYSLIEEQTKTLMLAELDSEYAFKVIDPPLVPEEPSGPQRTLIVILAVLLGGMLSTLGVLTRYGLRQNV
ncbi:MAG: LPS O-antigen length regulator, partial [Halomonadaceae bacterium]